MKNIQYFKDFIAQPRKALFVKHHNPDAYALGSSFGLSGFLKLMGHEVHVITPSDYPNFLHWMPGNEEVIIYDEKDSDRIKKIINESDVVFCLDFSALGRINDLGKYVAQSSAKKVLIDHHLEPEHFADFEQWDDKSASTAGLIFELIMALGDRKLIDSDIADCLYAGLMTDTGGFRHTNTRREEFMIASDLVSLGANPTRVSKLIYDTNSLDRLRLTGFVLSEKLQVVEEFRTAYITLTTEELRRFGSQTGDTEGFVNYGLSIKGIRFAALIYDRGGQIRLSFRSLGSFSVNEFARKHFNGGGHKNAAGGTSDQNLEVTVNKFLDLLPQYKNELSTPID
jgi:phosphoesterase RecJ-like protein